MDICPWSNGFGDQIPLESLLQDLSDDYPAVRENLLDAFVKASRCASVEPIATALNDLFACVRCAAEEAPGMMSERALPSVSPVL